MCLYILIRFMRQGLEFDAQEDEQREYHQYTMKESQLTSS